MKTVYAIVVHIDKDNNHLVYVPDFDLYTFGKDLADAFYMARDAMGLIALGREAAPSPIDDVLARDFSGLYDGELGGGRIYAVDVDFDEYRRVHDNRAVRRNVSIPAWLDKEAKEQGINVSAVLQRALKREIERA